MKLMPVTAFVFVTGYWFKYIYSFTLLIAFTVLKKIKVNQILYTFSFYNQCSCKDNGNITIFISANRSIWTIHTSISTCISILPLPLLWYFLKIKPVISAE